MRKLDSMMSKLTIVVQDWQDVRKASSLIYVSGPLLTCLVERSTSRLIHQNTFTDILVLLSRNVFISLYVVLNRGESQRSW